MRHAGVVQWLVGVGHVEAGLNQPGGQILADVAPSAQPVVLVRAFAPEVRPASVGHRRGLGMPPGVQVHVVIGTDSEGRNDVFLEVLVLIVAPHHHYVRFEIVQLPAYTAKLRGHGVAVCAGPGQALVVAPFGTHIGRPVGRVLVLLRNAGVAQGDLQDVGHLIVRRGQRRVVRKAESKYFCHGVLLLEMNGRSTACCVRARGKPAFPLD